MSTFSNRLSGHESGGCQNARSHGKKGASLVVLSVATRVSALALALSSGGLQWGVATAQEAAQPASDQNAASVDQDKRLDAVTVTAQKREQNLQDVPVAISAISSEKLESVGIGSTVELNIAVPGLNVTRQLSGFAPILRGVGNYNAAPGSEGAVATYVDGIYLPSAYGSVMSLANIERIEVLRGPQGTLFGRNATGGLIHVITKTPSHETSGDVSIGYGSQDTTEAKFYGTTGLSDSVAIDLGVYYRDQGEGFGTNLVTGSDTIYSNDFVARSKLKIDFSEATQLVLSADYAESESDLGLARRPDYGTVTLRGTPPPADFYDLNVSRDHKSDNSQWGVSGHIAHNFENMDLIGIISHREVDASFTIDQGEDAISFVAVDLPLQEETNSAEIQIKSNGDAWLEWIVGAYYFDSTAGVYPWDTSGPGFVGSTASAPGGPYRKFERTNVQETQSYSVFGEAVMDIAADTRLTLGARYTVDQRDYTSDTTFTVLANNALIVVPTINKEAEFKEPSWRVVLDHTFFDDTLTYISYSRGFKSGIFNAFSATGDLVTPEILDAYEVGVKSEVLDERLRLNAAAFFYKYSDLQLTTQAQGTTILVNAAEAETKGIELEALAAVGQYWKLSANVALIDTEFKDFPGAQLTTSNPTLASCPVGPPFPNCVTIGNAAGNELPRAPKLTYTIGASYERPVSVGTFGADMNFYYNDGFFNDFANRSGQASYTLVNASTYLNFGDRGQYRLMLYGKNIADTEYYSYGTSTALGDFISPSYGRQYGVSLRYSF